jgi:hypothetical protein
MCAEQGGHKSQPTALSTTCYIESLAVCAFAKSCWRCLESFSLPGNHLRSIYSIHPRQSEYFPHKTQGQFSFLHSGHIQHQVLHHNCYFIYNMWAFCAPVCYFVCFTCLLKTMPHLKKISTSDRVHHHEVSEDTRY